MEIRRALAIGWPQTEKLGRALKEVGGHSRCPSRESRGCWGGHGHPQAGLNVTASQTVGGSCQDPAPPCLQRSRSPGANPTRSSRQSSFRPLTSLRSAAPACSRAGWRRTGRRSRGARPGTVGRAGHGEGTGSIVNLQQERGRGGWGGQYGGCERDHVLVRAPAHALAPGWLLPRPLWSVVTAPGRHLPPRRQEARLRHYVSSCRWFSY